jgi:tape measure domain-containing protein
MGFVRRDELRSLLESAPTVMNVIADHYDCQLGELRKIASSSVEIWDLISTSPVACG